MVNLSCPYGPDWTALVNAVGLKEAVRDYLENDGEIRTPQIVLNKLKSTGYSPGIDYIFKSVEILFTDKAKQVFEKGKKNNWDLNKILTELEIPKEQKQLILSSGKTELNDIVTDLLANYSYTVEINTAKQEHDGDRTDYWFENKDFFYSLDQDSNKYYKWSKKTNKYYTPLEPEFEITKEQYFKELRDLQSKPTQYYSNLTVPGGTNYTENAHVIPAMKGKVLPDIYSNHDQEFANGDLNMYGWDRSDDKRLDTITNQGNWITSILQVPNEFTFSGQRIWKDRDGNWNQGNSYIEDTETVIWRYNQSLGNTISNTEFTKTRRILEIQSKFQKWRLNFEHKGNKYQILENQPTDNPNVFEDHYLENGKRITGKEYNKIFKEFLDTPTSQEDAFIKLIAKQWETLMIKSIIQDSAKKGYEKVLFPTGNTASKVEGHTTLEEFKKQKEDRIKELEKQKKEYLTNDYTIKKGLDFQGREVYKIYNKGKEIFSRPTEELAKKLVVELEINDSKNNSKITKSKFDDEINQLKQELERIEREGFGALRPIWDFYENTVTNILINDIYGKESKFVNYEFIFNNDKYEKLNDKNQYLKNGKEISQKEFNRVQSSVTKQDKKEGKFIDKYYINSNAFITDEYGNTWNEVTINDDRDLNIISFQRFSVTDIINKEILAGVTVNRTQSNNLAAVKTLDSISTRIFSFLSGIVKPRTDKAQAERLSEQIVSENQNLNYEFISRDKAYEITRDLANPFTGTESGFFVGNTVYFVNENIKPDTVFHEFSHLFIRTIRLENPKLFDNLYNKLKSTEIGKAIIDSVNANYPEYQGKNYLAMEEALVIGLSAASVKEDTGTLSQFLKDLLYAIKQVLRKIFGSKINISKLEATTSLQDLANMLAEGEQFVITEQALTEEEIAAYEKTQQDFINELVNLKPQELQAIATRAHNSAINQIQTARKNQNFKEIAEIAIDEFERGDLQEIARLTGEYSKPFDKKLLSIEEQIKRNRDMAEAVVNTLQRIDLMIRKIEKHVEELNKKDSLENLHRSYYYKSFLSYWETFANELTLAMDNTVDKDGNKIDTAGPVASLVNSISRNISRSLKETMKYFKDGVKDVIYNELTVMADTIKARYEETEKSLQQRNAPSSVREDYHKEFYGLTFAEKARKEELERKKKSSGINLTEIKELESLKTKALDGAQLTEEKIELALEGRLKDANIFNSFFEGYLYNTDPVVGGFALYLKNQLADVSNTFQVKAQNFISDVSPLFEQAGINPANVDQLINRIGRVKIIKKLEDGKLVDRKVYELKSRYKDWEAPLDEISHKVEKAKEAFAESNSEEDRLILRKAVKEQKKFLRDFFHQKYVPEVYAKDVLFEDEIGEEAGLRLEIARAELRKMQYDLEKDNDPDDTLLDRIKYKKQEIEQLYSLYDLNGKPKTGIEREISLRLREYRAMSKDANGESFYELKPRTGLFNNAFIKLQQRLINQGLTLGSPEFNAEVNKWVLGNTQVKLKQEYYDELRKNYKIIDSILSKLGDSTQNKETKRKLTSSILDIIAGAKDDFNQIDPTMLTEAGIAKIKSIEEEIESLKSKGTGLKGLSPQDKKDLFKAFGNLEKLSKVRANDRYIMELNHHISLLSDEDKRKFQAKFNLPLFFSNDTADGILSKAVMDYLSNLSPDFKSWIEKNHYLSKRFGEGGKEEVYKRIYIWNEKVPNDNSYYETTTVKDINGDDVLLFGVPNVKYNGYYVKQKYYTKRVVGETVDNKGNFLPRLDGADRRFIDEEYLNMDKSDPIYFQILEKITKHHLEAQEGLPKRSKLYLDLPRFHKNALEVVKTKKLKDMQRQAIQGNFPLIDYIVRRAKDFFGKLKAQNVNAEQYGWKDEFILSRADMFNTEPVNIPIHGLYDIDIEDVSMDIPSSIMRYMFSAEKQKKLIQINPVAQALKTIVNDPANGPKELDKISSFNFINKGILSWINKKSFYVRKYAVNNLIEREFEGKTQAGWTKDNVFLNEMSNLVFSRASFSFFALNAPSALKNVLGSKFQSMIEGAGGIYVDLPSLGKGETWSTTTMAQISAGIYSRNTKPLNIQLADSFDAIRGRSELKLPESLSRTLAHDVANFSWLYNFRKWTENQSALQLFAGMMYKKKIKQNGKDIDYIDAWELVDNKLSLKKGIDVRYSNLPTNYVITAEDTLESIAGKLNMSKEDLEKIYKKDLKEGDTIKVDNTYFKDFRNKIHTVHINLNGAYAEFDQPEGNRYLLFRFISFMKKYFTPMLMNRWGYSGNHGRYNPGLGDMHQGYYVTMLKSVYRAMKTGGQYWGYMTEEEKKSYVKFIAEVAGILVISMIIAPLLGWDPDDPDRYEKMRERSGNLPFPFVEEDPEHPFQSMGYLENHMLKLALDVRSESEAFLPWPGIGLDHYSKTFTDLSSIGSGPTIKTYKELFELAIDEISGDPYGRYKKDVGPYDWQKENGSKFVTELAKAIGFTGSTIDPVTNLKNTQGALLRR